MLKTCYIAAKVLKGHGDSKKKKTVSTFIELCSLCLVVRSHGEVIKQLTCSLRKKIRYLDSLRSESMYRDIRGNELLIREN